MPRLMVLEDRLAPAVTTGISDSVGVYRAPYLFYLDTNPNHMWDSSDTIASYGTKGDIPVVGDWTGSGITNIGIFRNGTWYLNTTGSHSYSSADTIIHFGQTGDIPVVGDWDGSGHAEVGVFRNGTWLLNTQSGVVTFSYGQSGDIPVVGDWTGSGHAEVGVFRSGTWILDTNNSHTLDSGDTTFSYGQAGDIPVVGRWDGTGKAEVGVYRGSTFYVDAGNTHTFAQAKAWGFGSTGDTPLVGDWALASPTSVQITTAPLDLTAGTSGPVTLQLRDGFGNVVPAGTAGLSVALSTTSSGGTFLSGGNPVTSVIIPAGASSVTVTYLDTTVGTPTVSASAPRLKTASQVEEMATPLYAAPATPDPLTTVGVVNGSTWVVDSGQSHSFSSGTTYIFGQAGYIPIVGDWTGTGTKQMGVFYNGTWYLDTNGDHSFDAGDTTISFGQAGDVPVVGDWDGSGHDEVGVFRNGAWLLDTPTGIVTFTFGQAGDIPVVGDWARTGINDQVGVFRNGTWILDVKNERTLDSAAAVYTFGQAGDIPVVGAFSNDGFNDGIGVYRAGTFYLDSNGNHTLDAGDATFAYGQAGSTPVVGDWGKQPFLAPYIDPAVFRSGRFLIQPSGPNPDNGVIDLGFGQSSDIPVVGDWNGDGTLDVGSYRNGAFYLHITGTRDTVSNEQTNDMAFNYGTTGDIPVVGSWTGNGVTNVGVFRSGTWYLDSNGSHSYDSGDTVIHFGQAGDIPVVGDWDGSGHSEIGVFRNGTWLLNTQSGIVTFTFGQAGDIPLVGDWTHSGHAEVGVYRNGTWILDTNNNHQMDSGDYVTTFGQAGDVPVVGDWYGTGNSVARASEALKAKVLAAIPNLESLISTQPLQGADQMVNWVSNNITFGLAANKTDYINQTTFRLAWESASDTYYNVYQPDMGGTWCAGDATWGQRVFELFGYDAFTVAMGVQSGGLGHVTLVLPVSVAGQWQYYIFDPSYNVRFMDSTTGTYTDYFAMIDDLHSGNLSNITPVNVPMTNREYLDDGLCGLSGVVFQSNVGSFLKYTYPGYGFTQYLSDEQPAFIADGLPTGLAGFVSLLGDQVFQVGPGINSVPVQAFLANLKARGIPYSGTT